MQQIVDGVDRRRAGRTVISILIAPLWRRGKIGPKTGPSVNWRKASRPRRSCRSAGLLNPEMSRPSIALVGHTWMATGVPPSAREAANWFEKAASRGACRRPRLGLLRS